MNFAGMDLNLLRVFDAVMRERSVTRAGEQIGLSQPAVSAALNRLRFPLDDQLFVRRGNELSPTPRAEALAEPVREAMAGLERALIGDRRFDPATIERTYTLLGADFFSMMLMPALSERLAAQAPGVRLRLLDSGMAGIDRMLQDDAIDVGMEAYEAKPPEWVSHQRLFHAPFVIAAARSLPALVEAGVKPGERLPLDLFCSLPHALRTKDGGFYGRVDEALAKVGRSRRVVLGLPHFYAVALAAARGGLIAAIPRPLADVFAEGLGLSCYEPPMETPAPEVHMFWHRRHDANPAHRWLRDQIVAALRQEGVNDGP
jgi:DNA-binding transcriptional LysR family regulator